MSDEAKVTMILCQDLVANEQEKVERLDMAISEQFNSVGQVVRLCRAHIHRDQRVLEFCHAPLGVDVVVTVPANEFVAASDPDALAMIMP